MNPYTSRTMLKDPSAFVGRREKICDIYGLLSTMQSCSVVGPRRIGKSSLLYHLTHPSVYSSYLPDPESYVFAFLDLQELASLGPDDFFFTAVARLCRASDGQLGADPAQYGSLSGFRRFLMRAVDAKLQLVLCCDEFEMLSQNPRFTAEIFTYLRGLCSNYNLALVTSSRTSLFDLCHQGDLQTSQFWNIFVEQRLGLMPEDEAQTLIREPFTRAGGNVKDAEISFVLDLAGRHPFFVQIACYYLFKFQSDSRQQRYQSVRHCFSDEARRHYTYAWEQLDEPEKKTLTVLACGESLSSIEPQIFRSLKRSALVTGSPDSPLLVSAGWRQFIVSQLPKQVEEEEEEESSTREVSTLSGSIRNRWALLIGIDRYIDPAFPGLKFCVNDVLALERMLSGLDYTVVALHDDVDEERLLPTRDNIEAELARLCQVAGPDDLLLVHFACHGKLIDDQALLVTRETRAPTLTKRALPVAEVERQVRESEARRLLLSLDACHTGVETGREVADPEFIQGASNVTDGLALIAASTAQQIAHEWHEKEHGVFTYYFLEGLSGRADSGDKDFVTVSDLTDYILDNLRRWNVKQGGLIQEPTIATGGMDEVVLADYRNRAVPLRQTRLGTGRGRQDSHDRHMLQAYEETVSYKSMDKRETRIGQGQIAASYALLIGIGSYIHPRFASLPATLRDTRAIADALTDPSLCGYPSDHVHTITGSDATAANIRTAMEGLAESLNSESTAFIYFSGHGGRALENGQWRTYLCPREADPDDLPNTAISGDEFSAALSAIPARRVLVVLDACHAGGSAELKAANGTLKWKSGLPEDYYEALSQGSGRVVIASSKTEQYSRVRPEGDLSLFTYHLRDALNGKAAVRGDGLIHVLDVFHYVNEAVQADEPKQTPILKVNDLDLNFPIAVAPAEVSEAPKASKAASEVEDIREQIVRDPIAGAKALSEYLEDHRDLAAKRNEVDLKRSQLEDIQHDLDLFGPDPAKKAEKNRTVFYLLRVCRELEQASRRNSS